MLEGMLGEVFEVTSKAVNIESMLVGVSLILEGISQMLEDKIARCPSVPDCCRLFDGLTLSHVFVHLTNFTGREGMFANRYVISGREGLFASRYVISETVCCTVDDLMKRVDVW